MTLLPKSKMESIPVAKRDSDTEDMAAYTVVEASADVERGEERVARCMTTRAKLAPRLAQTAILTWSAMVSMGLDYFCWIEKTHR